MSSDTVTSQVRIFVPPTSFPIFQRFYTFLKKIFWRVLQKYQHKFPVGLKPIMRVCYSGVHYHPQALDTTLYYFQVCGITVGEPLSRSLAVSRQIRTAHSCSLRHPAQQDIVQMIPQGREAGSSFPPCFFSLHSHLQRLLPPPAHDVTYIRTKEEHIYNTVERRHRQRERETQKKELLRLTFLDYSPCSHTCWQQ